MDTQDLGHEATQMASTQQKFRGLPIGTIVESLLFEQHSKIGSGSWAKVDNPSHSRNTNDNYDIANLALRTNSPFTVMSTPEV